MTETSSNHEKFESLDAIADRLNDRDIPVLLKNIQRTVRLHADQVGEKRPDILASRFTPAQEAYDKGLWSCGALTNIAAAMVKHLGYEVRFIHGQIPSTPTHAWIAIKDKEGDEWQQYDLMRKDCHVTPDHKAEYTVDDWEEIRSVLEEHYNKNHPEKDNENL